MIDLNVYWQLFETMFKQRKSWYIPESIYRKKPSDKDIIRKLNMPGAIIPYQSGSPYSTLLSQIQQKEDELEYVSKNVMKGIYYGVDAQIYAKAKKTFEETEESNIQTFKGESRLQTLYGTSFKIEEFWDNETQRLNISLIRPEPHVYYTAGQISRTPIRMDSDDEES